MSEPTKPCDYCGFPNPLTARICEACGQPIRFPTQEPTLMVPRPPVDQPEELKEFKGLIQTEEPVPPAEPAVQAAEPPAPELPEARKIADYPMVTPQAPQKKNRTGLIVALILSGGLLCLLVAAAVGYFLFRNLSTRLQPKLESLVETGETAVAVIPGATFEPLPLEATAESLVPLETPVPGLPADIPQSSGAQILTDTYIFDDFSTNDLEWATSSDEISIHQWEEGAYTILVQKPEYVAWTDIPVEFFPVGVEFDVWVPAGGEGGSFGLLCFKQSDEDYYYVEMDIADQTYSIGRYLNDEYTPLTEPSWPSTDALNTGSEVNHVLATCEADLITLFVNNQFVGQVTLSEPAEPGEMAIFGSTWENMPPEGFKVYFDNLSAWKPVQ